MIEAAVSIAQLIFKFITFDRHFFRYNLDSFTTIEIRNPQPFRRKFQLRLTGTQKTSKINRIRMFRSITAEHQTPRDYLNFTIWGNTIKCGCQMLSLVSRHKQRQKMNIRFSGQEFTPADKLIQEKTHHIQSHTGSTGSLHRAFDKVNKLPQFRRIEITFIPRQNAPVNSDKMMKNCMNKRRVEETPALFRRKHQASFPARASLRVTA